jgi:hypothetical protein
MRAQIDAEAAQIDALQQGLENMRGEYVRFLFPFMREKRKRRGKKSEDRKEGRKRRGRKERRKEDIFHHFID